MKLEKKISTKKRLSSSKKRRLAKKISRRRRQNGGDRGYEYCMIKINKFKHGTKATFGKCNANISDHLTPKQISALEFELKTMMDIKNTSGKYQYLFGYILQLCGYYAYRYNKDNNPGPYTIHFTHKIDGIMYNILILMFILTNNIFDDHNNKKLQGIHSYLTDNVFKLLLSDQSINIDCNEPAYNKDDIFKYIVCVINQCLNYISNNPERTFKLPNDTEFIKGETLSFIKEGTLAVVKGKKFDFIISPLTVPYYGADNLEGYVEHMKKKYDVDMNKIYDNLYKKLKGYVSYDDEQKNIFKYISLTVFDYQDNLNTPPPTVYRGNKPQGRVSSLNEDEQSDELMGKYKKELQGTNSYV